MGVNEMAYAGSFLIPPPMGVYQAAGDTNISTDYAYRAQNIRTQRGLLATSFGTSRAFPSRGEPIETLTRFYRRNRPDVRRSLSPQRAEKSTPIRWARKAGRCARKASCQTGGAM